MTLRFAGVILLGLIGLVAFNPSEIAILSELLTGSWRALQGLGIALAGVIAIALMIARPSEDASQIAADCSDSYEQDMPGIIARARAKCARSQSDKKRNAGSVWVVSTKSANRYETKS